MSFIYRPYQQGDEKAILRAFSQIFSSYRDLAIWRRIYQENPHGSHIMLACSEETGELAAHYACTAHEACYQGELIKIGFVRDLFSVPSYRSQMSGRHSAFARLIKYSLKIWTEQENIAILYGFPSHRSFRLGKIIHNYQLITGWHHYIYQVPHFNPPSNASLGTIQKINYFTDNVEQLWKKHQKNYPFSICRTANFLNWRFSFFPYKDYQIFIFSPYLSSEIIGYVVVLPTTPTAILVDYCFPNELVLAQSFWNQLIGIFKQKNIKMIQTWCSSFCPEKNLFEQLKFQRIQPPADFVVSYYNDYSTKVTNEWLEQNFYFNMADSDLY